MVKSGASSHARSSPPASRPARPVGCAERSDEVDRAPALSVIGTASELGHAAPGYAMSDEPEQLSGAAARDGSRAKIARRMARLRVADVTRAMADGAVLAINPRSGRNGTGAIRHERAPVRGGIGLDYERRQPRAHAE